MSKTFSQEVRASYQKSILVNGHSKYFEIDFGSIQTNFLPNVWKNTFSQVLCSMQFMKNMILVFLTDPNVEHS